MRPSSCPARYIAVIVLPVPGRPVEQQAAAKVPPGLAEAVGVPAEHDRVGLDALEHARAGG